MAVKYKEVHEPGQYELTVTAEGIRGKRTFLQFNDLPGGIDPASLPVVGTSTMVDLDGNSISACICRSSRAIFFAGDGNSRGIECDYSTEVTSSSRSGGSGIGPKDPASRTYELSLEEQTIMTGSSDGKIAKFEFEGAAAGTEYADQAVPIFAMVGALTIPHENQAMTSTERDAFLTLCLAYGRSINNAAFEGYNAGQVRFDGYSGADYYNEDGEQRWAYELHFSVRLIGTDLSSDAAITEDDWLYQINEKEGTYRKLKNHGTGKYLYAKKDFAALIAIPTPP